jgi:hypothetical protein
VTSVGYELPLWRRRASPCRNGQPLSDRSTLR